MPEADGMQVAPVDRPYQGNEAGIVTRVAAAVIDGVIVLLILLLGYGALVGVLFLLTPRSFTFPDASLLFGVVSFSVVAVVYFGVSWWLDGRSQGDAIMGIRVVNSHGQRLNLATSLLRALLYCLFPVGLLWAAVSTHNRSLQDIVVGTTVVYDWSR